ncbi:MAG: hypothetical protein JRN16_06260 [Nitrososphaerota archaeon]|nr:hypothetical protein [Nitrososphaerota archaeon]MDG7027994.1 hypothetical protein [Nitrososphaerota archaeon]
MADPDRKNSGGLTGYSPSSVFRAILLMYLLSMGSVSSPVKVMVWFVG